MCEQYIGSLELRTVTDIITCQRLAESDRHSWQRGLLGSHFNSVVSAIVYAIDQMCVKHVKPIFGNIGGVTYYKPKT